jgi:hypothetical protein
MKMNKWTLGLAAVGLVSLTPGLRAADTGPTPVPVTALTATTISGYVDTSAVWNPGTGNANPAPYAFNAGKQDGFNVNMVDIKLSKPLEEGQWSAGYTAELNYGPDSFAALGGFAPIRQAYISLRMPVGNGIDWQIGQWDGLLGYESTDTYKNPNFTESYGKTLEPTEHIGVLASYKFSDCFTAQVGVANELTAGFNRNFSGHGFSTIESKKAIVSLISLTAPDSWGSLKGSGLYVGLDYGPGNALNIAGTHVVDKTHLYVGTTVMTPVTGLTVGAAWDSVNNSDVGFVEGYAGTIAGYVSYKLSDKATLNGRAEYAHGSAFDNLVVQGKAQEAKIFAVTGTLQYDLWANVISRLEVRWDTSADGSPHFGGTTPFVPTKNNELTVAANVIYKF